VLWSLVIGAVTGGCDRGRAGSTPAPTTEPTAAVTAAARPANDGQVPTAVVADDAPACGALTAMGRSEPQPLLADRLRVRSIAGAENNPVPWDVMGAPDATEDRSRVYVETGEHGLAIVATEMYQRAGKDFVAQAAAELAAEGGEVVRVDTSDPGLVLVARLPTDTPKIVGDSAFLLSGWLAHEDGTVQMIEIATFPHEVTSVPGCRNFALSIAASLAPGERKLETSAGPRTLDLFGTKFVATVPENWVVATQPGPDFVVVRLRELAEFPLPAPELGIALTDHPPPLSNENVSASQRGRLLGKAVTWHLGEVKSATGKTVLFAQARAKLGRDVADAWVHTLDPGARTRALKIADEMRTTK
jgi:hypothetical protein